MKITWILLVLISIILVDVNAIVFKRRIKPDSEMSYYVFPIYTQIPGLGNGYGFGYYVSDFFESEVIGVHLKGDINAHIIMIKDIPMDSDHLTFSLFYALANDLKYNAYGMGANSEPDYAYELSSKEIEIIQGEAGLHYFDNQLEFYLNYGAAQTIETTVTSSEGFEYLSESDDVVLYVNGYRLGAFLDDTDDRRDPHIGYRLKYERWGFVNHDKRLSDGYLEDFDISFFIPVMPHRLIWVTDLFYSHGKITRVAEIDPNDYRCPANAPPECELISKYAKEAREEEAKKGNATSLGGNSRLRSYPQGRFYDSYSVFFGNELRLYCLNGWRPFDYFLYKGVQTSLQVAFFYELGQVAAETDTLFDDMIYSYGAGMRLVLNDAVVRLDYATGEEGAQLTIFWGYPF